MVAVSTLAEFVVYTWPVVVPAIIAVPAVLMAMDVHTFVTENVVKVGVDVAILLEKYNDADSGGVIDAAYDTMAMVPAPETAHAP